MLCLFEKHLLNEVSDSNVKHKELCRIGKSIFNKDLVLCYCLNSHHVRFHSWPEVHVHMQINRYWRAGNKRINLMRYDWMTNYRYANMCIEQMLKISFGTKML